MTNEGEKTEQKPAVDVGSSDMVGTWRVSLYQSGTQTVSRNMPDRPHYHVGHLTADNEGDHGRYEVSKELETWLNGGPEPWWMDMLNRTSADAVQTPHGCRIRATGPMVDKATPPAWGYWCEDDSDDAQIERGLLADALMNRRVPTGLK